MARWFRFLNSTPPRRGRIKVLPSKARQVLIWGVFGLIFLPSWALADSLNITLSKNEATLGEVIKITVSASDPAGADHVSLFITEESVTIPLDRTQICQEANKPQEGQSTKMHFKTYLGGGGGDWDWNTQVHQTKAGIHQIIAVQMKSDRNTACHPDNILSIGSTTINMVAADTVGPPGGGGGTTDGGGMPEIRFPKISISPPGTGEPEQGQPPLLGGDNWLRELFVRIINKLLQIGGILAVLALIYSGIMYITAAGNPQKSEAAKKNIIWAITGLVIMLLGLLIVNWIPTILQTGGP